MALIALLADIHAETATVEPTMLMRGKGINYDTGFFPGGASSRESCDPDVVRRELQIIADDLHCTAVRISGGVPARLTVAAEHAAAAGLQVWFSRFPCELTTHLT